MSDKIKFRELVINDKEKLYEIYSDKEAMKYRGSKPMESIHDAIAFVKNKKLIEEKFLTIRKGVELIEEQKLIGSVMFRFENSKESECEIGYSIGRKYWGRGLGKEIVKTLINTLKEDSKIKKVKAWSNKNNIASMKILEKNEFQREEQNEGNYLYQRLIGRKSSII